MELHNTHQGSPEWLALRAQPNTFTASEAPVMMGVSSHMTRSALLAQKNTGLVPEVDASTQRRFDLGHETEAAFRPVAESLIDDDLYPVTGTIEIAGLRLLASFDGLTMDRKTGFEHKLYNRDIANDLKFKGEPGPAYYWQLEHQLLVSGAERILFVTSDGAAEGAAHCWYESKPHRRAALISCWKQFAEDLAVYTPPAPTEAAPTGKAPETLPALRIEVTGMVTASNLAEFKRTALAVFGGINRTLTTDADFANAEQAVKWCGDVEDRLDAARQHALSQTASIDDLFRTITDISAEARRVRLELDKLVKARKEAIRGDIVLEGRTAYDAHIRALNERIGKAYLSSAYRNIPEPDFAGVIRGKRTIDSLRDAVATELAHAKIAANEVADRIQVNLREIQEHQELAFLFADVAKIVLKDPEDLRALVESRIAKHKAAEAKKEAETRARIRVEEERKANREAMEKLEAFRRQESETAAQAVIAAAQTPAAALETAAPIPAPATVTVRLMTPPLFRAEKEDSGARIKLGEINARIEPLSITADGLASLGFPHVATDKSAKLFRESDWPEICAALARHITNAAVMHKPHVRG